MNRYNNLSVEHARAFFKMRLVILLALLLTFVSSMDFLENGPASWSVFNVGMCFRVA